MAAPIFSVGDFRVFDIPDFAGRMQAIGTQIRPKLTALGGALAPGVGQLVGGEVFAHVAKHARRTVNPPGDTWVAFGPERRGYKKGLHFKVAISRNCVRVLFEVGPEHQAKRRWTSRFERRKSDLLAALRRGKDIGWFKDEHDEDPVGVLKDLGAEQIGAMTDELNRRKDGQFVVGRRIAQDKVSAMTSQAFQKEALDTFRTLAPLFRLE
jgi:uncharacterized protein YktB (UPF0637 family)